MRINDEWRTAATAVLVKRGDVHLVSVQALDAILCAVAPLIAKSMTGWRAVATDDPLDGALLRVTHWMPLEPPE